MEPSTLAPAAACEAPTAAALERLGRDQDTAAWSYLVERHGEAVGRLIRSQVAAVHADDALQQAFLAIRDASPAFRRQPAGTEPSAIAWLLRVACNAGCRFERDQWRRLSRAHPLIEGALSAPPPDADDDGARAAAALRSALASLPDRHRVALHLHFHAALTYPELAAAFSSTVNAARVRVHRALRALKSRLAREGASLSVVAIAHQLAGRPPPAAPLRPTTPAHHPPHRPRHPPHGIPLMATVSVGALGCALALALFAHPVHGADAAADPPPPTQAAAFAIDPARRPDVAITVALAETDLPELLDLFNRVLRIPLSVDARVTIADLPPITFQAKHMRALDGVKWMCALTDLHLRKAADGSLRLTTTPAPAGAPEPAPAAREPHLPATIAMDPATPQAWMRAIGTACGSADAVLPTAYPDERPLSLRVRLADVRAYDLLQAIGHGASSDGLPFNRLLATTLSVGFDHATIAAALAEIAQASGLPCRYDPESGPMPLLSRAPEPIACGRLLQQIADATQSIASEAADGLVIYRPRNRRFNPSPSANPGSDPAPAGATPWAWCAAAWAKTPCIELPMPLDARILSVAWRERSVAEVAEDLHRRLAVPVTVDPSALAHGQRILVCLSPRALADILTCLHYASGCTWTTDGSSILVRADDPPSLPILPSQPPAPQPQVAPKPAPAPAPAQGSGAAPPTSNFLIMPAHG